MSAERSSQMSLLIKGGRVIDPGNQIDGIADILVQQGKITRIDRMIPSPPEDVRIIDAQGLTVTPGLIDIHVHLREPGQEVKETIITGAEAAAAGGFTAVAAMPNTRPPVDSPMTLAFVLSRASATKVRVYPIACVTVGQEGRQLVDMEELAKGGAVAFSDDGNPIARGEIMEAALKQSIGLGAPIIPHEEDRSLTEGGHINEGVVSERLGVKGMPREAEDRMIARDLKLLEQAGGRLHIAHVSTVGAVMLVREAKAKGLPVTCEACPHHFTLTEETVISLGGNAKMSPPLRTAEDVEAVQEGLVDGTIDVIVSDHAPHTPQEKSENLTAAPFGVIGLETSLGVVLTQLVHSGKMSLPEVLAKMTVNPAQILSLKEGRLTVGGSADLTLIDPDAEWTVEVEKFRSKARNSPLNGWPLRGKAVMTVVEGRIAYEALST